MDDFVFKEKAKEQMLEPFLEYAGACHVDSIVDDMSREDMLNDIPPSPELDKRIKKLIRNRRRKANIQKLNRGILRVMPKVAIFMLILFASFFILFTSVEAFRVGVYNLIIEVQKEYSSIRIEEDNDNNDNTQNYTSELPPEWQDVSVPKFIPEGFEISTVESLMSMKMIHYMNQEGQLIVYQQKIGKNLEMNVDTENVEMEDIFVNGLEGLLVRKGSRTTLIWHDNNIIFSLISQDVEEDIILQMARSVKIN